jgi:hypothetical protein
MRFRYFIKSDEISTVSSNEFEKMRGKSTKASRMNHYHHPANG